MHAGTEPLGELALRTDIVGDPGVERSIWTNLGDHLGLPRDEDRLAGRDEGRIAGVVADDEVAHHRDLLEQRRPRCGEGSQTTEGATETLHVDARAREQDLSA